MNILAWQIISLLVGKGVGGFFQLPCLPHSVSSRQMLLLAGRGFHMSVFLPVYWGLPKPDGSSLTTAGSPGLLAVLEWQGSGGAWGSSCCGVSVGLCLPWIKHL